MKKFISIFILSIITIFCNAQVDIVPNQPDKITKVCTGYCKIYQDTHTNEYFLMVVNNHQNVRQYFQITIKLGNTPDEAIKSMEQIEDLYENAKDGDEFIISGYKCYVKKGIIYGKIQFPRNEYENDFFDGIFYMSAYFGKLKIYRLAKDCYKCGDF